MTEKVELKGHVFEIRRWIWREKNLASSMIAMNFPEIAAGKRKRLTLEERGQFTHLFNQKMMEACVLSVDGQPAGELLERMVFANPDDPNLGDELLEAVQRINGISAEDEAFLPKSSPKT